VITLQRQTHSSVKPIAGVAAAVSLAVVAFASGLAAMDHMAYAAQRSTANVSGSFRSEIQGDYRSAPIQRIAPQRSTTR